jgi:hypothetical protein
MGLVADGGVNGPDDEGTVDEENERAGVWGGGGEWKVFLYAKRTCFGLVVVWWGMVKEVGGTMRGHGLFYRMVRVIKRNTVSPHTGS